MPNDLSIILESLRAYREPLQGLVVESTYNWYWLVDGLIEAGYRVHRRTRPPSCNTKDSSTPTTTPMRCSWPSCCAWGSCRKGISTPGEGRAVRDLLRKRSQLVQQSACNLGRTPNGNTVKRMDDETVERLMADECRALAVKSNPAIMQALESQIKVLEREVKARARVQPQFQPLLTVNGIGDILGLTILLETGDIGRFPR